MSVELQERQVGQEALRKFGARWAVLTAMRLDMAKQGIEVGLDVDEQLSFARMKILSGCFSPCEVACTLSKIEGRFVSKGFTLGTKYLQDWSDLLAQAMRGEIDPRRVVEIPALRPVEMDCRFLACGCS
jgi:hypothetical protein